LDVSVWAGELVREPYGKDKVIIFGNMTGEFPESEINQKEKRKEINN
jgi:hypothetical protein